MHTYTVRLSITRRISLRYLWARTHAAFSRTLSAAKALPMDSNSASAKCAMSAGTPGNCAVPGTNSPLVELAMELINVESLSGHEQPMSAYLRGWLEKRGWTVDLQEVAPQKSTVDGRARHNVYARRPGDRPQGPRVLFNSHIDTVRRGKRLVCLIDWGMHTRK